MVARLKWGDPFVFDRGGEEALFLHEQGVPFEVVPGVPAGIAVPAYAGVPVTYPGGGDTLTFVRGYEDESRTAPDVDWASLARLDGTIVCYAGAQQLPRILDALLATAGRRTSRRRSSTTARCRRRRRIAGTLDELLRARARTTAAASRRFSSSAASSASASTCAGSTRGRCSASASW